MRYPAHLPRKRKKGKFHGRRTHSGRGYVALLVAIEGDSRTAIR